MKFENVINVSSKNISQSKTERFLDFLTMETVILKDKTCEINLIFSGDAIIKVKAEVIEITLDDQGSPWITKNKPKHNFL